MENKEKQTQQDPLQQIRTKPATEALSEGELDNVAGGQACSAGAHIRTSITEVATTASPTGTGRGPSS